MTKPINVAIVGLGNCASSLVQGIYKFKANKHYAHQQDGIMQADIGGYQPYDISVLLGFDVDHRKVNTSVGEAIFAKPNNTIDLYTDARYKCTAPTYMVPVLDGVADHMKDYPKDKTFVVDDDILPLTRDQIIRILKSNNIDIIVNYLPVGSQKATEFWAEICLETKIAFVNCIPVFIASNPLWEQRFIDAGVPIVGDDMKSQFGASILSQVLQSLALERGHKVNCHIQTNHGGNTDFLNMTDKQRLKSKKISKMNAITSQNKLYERDEPKDSIYAGPSEYIPYLKDNKVAHIRMELEGFCGSPVELDLKLSVIDSPNSAGVVIDAIRYLKVAQELGIVGALKGPSAWTQKTPPVQLKPHDAKWECDQLAQRIITENMVKRNGN